MPKLNCYIRNSLETAIERRRQQTGASKTQIVQTALAQYFGNPQVVQGERDARAADRRTEPIRRRRWSARRDRPQRLELHTLFHVSTARSQVAGLYDGAATVGDVEGRGNFGLGTFAGLDDELVVVDGNAYQIEGSGTVKGASAGAPVPFAVVTYFEGGAPVELAAISSLEALQAECDKVRRSNDHFHAFRIDGRFRHVGSRACDFFDMNGTLVGIWSPQYAASFSVPGYHFYFVSEDRSKGGHLLLCDGVGLTLRSQPLLDFHLVLPESAIFLQADLSLEATPDLAVVDETHLG
jgi:acetolactate decarboxylase